LCLAPKNRNFMS